MYMFMCRHTVGMRVDIHVDVYRQPAVAVAASCSSPQPIQLQLILAHTGYVPIVGWLTLFVQRHDKGLVLQVRASTQTQAMSMTPCSA